MVARLFWVQEVGGSNPSAPTILQGVPALLCLTQPNSFKGLAIPPCLPRWAAEGRIWHREGTTEAPELSAGGLGHSPKVAQRKPAPFEIPHAWLACAAVAANARPGYSGNRAIDIEVIPAGHLYVAKAVIREGSRHIARLVGDSCPTELEALHSLDHLFIRFAGSSP